jgi:periplasmic divalent cation tolerance protein
MSTDERHVRIIVSTVKDDAQSGQLGEQLLSQGLAACVTVLPGARSRYVWQGELCDEQEQVLLIKTAWRDEHEQRWLFERIAELHPYDEPEIVALRPDAVSQGYAAWVRSGVRDFAEYEESEG